MKNKWYVLLIIIISAMLVSACGTTESMQSSGKAKATNGSKVEENKDAGSESEEKNEDTTEEEDTVIRLFEQNITYLVEGSEQEETGFLNTSTNQDFSLYVFEGFQLEAEEPGKDVVLLSENKDVFMRIELFPEDVDWTLVEQNSTDQLKAVNETVQHDVWGQPDSLLEGATMLHAANADAWVQVLLIKDNPNYPNMKLTIHVPTEDEVVGKLLAIAKTIGN